MSSVEEDGAIAVEGEVIGRIAGLSFVPGEQLAGGESKLLKQAAVQALTTEVTARAIALSTTADTELRLSRQGDIVWQGHPIGRLQGGDARFKPRVDVVADDLLSPSLREDVRQRLQKFVDRAIAAQIEPLLKLEEAEGLEGAVRGLAFRLAESFGVLAREDVAEEVKALTQDERAKLRNHGVRFGAHSIFLPALLKPAPTEVRLLLWWLEQVKAGVVSGPVPALPPNGLTSMLADVAMPQGFYRLGGYRVSGKRAVRVDMLERLADLIRDRLFWKPRIPEEARPAGAMEGGGFTVIPDMMSVVGCSGEDFQDILTSLGYRSQIRKVAKQVPQLHVKVEAAEAATEVPADVVEGAAPVEVPVVDAEVQVPIVEEAAPAAVVPDADMVEIAVWWPNGLGPFKAKPPRPDKRHHGKTETPEGEQKRPRFDKSGDRNGERGGRRDKSARPEKGGKKDWGSKPERSFEKPKRAEKPLDPLSPFAALAALKASMGTGKP